MCVLCAWYVGDAYVLGVWFGVCVCVFVCVLCVLCVCAVCVCSMCALSLWYLSVYSRDYYVCDMGVTSVHCELYLVCV